MSSMATGGTPAEPPAGAPAPQTSRRASRRARTSTKPGRLPAVWAALSSLLPTILFVAVASASITSKPLSRDEMATLLFGRLSFSNLLHATRHVDAAFLPYYSLIHLTPAINEHPLLIRVWSLVAGALTVLFTALVAAELWSWWCGLIAGAVLAVNGGFIGLAQTARPGILAAMFAAIATYLLVRAWTRGSSLWLWVGYAVAVGLSAWCTLFAVLTIGAHVVLALVWWVRRDRRTFVHYVAATVVGLLIIVPLLLSTSGQSGQISWIVTKSATAGVQMVEQLAGMTGHFGSSDIPRVLVLYVVLAVVVLGGLSAPRLTGRLAVGPLLVVIPPLGLYIASQVVQPLEISRYAVAVPAGIALTAGGACWVASRWLRAIRPAAALAVVLILACAVWAQFPGVQYRFTKTTYDNFPGVAANLEHRLHKGERFLYVQNYEATGVVAGFAMYTHDKHLLADLERRLPHGTTLIFPRRVVGTHPLRTVATTIPAGHVLVIGGPVYRPDESPKLYWAAALKHTGCALVEPPGMLLSVWTCPAGSGY